MIKYISKDPLLDESEDSQENDDHEEGNQHHGADLVKCGDAAEFSVVGNFLLIVLKAPDFGDEDADQDTADGHQEICGKHIQPVVEALGGKSLGVEPGKF